MLVRPKNDRPASALEVQTTNLNRSESLADESLHSEWSTSGQICAGQFGISCFYFAEQFAQ